MQEPTANKPIIATSSRIAYENPWINSTMDMVLTVSPAFDADNEVHVRFVDKSENPYLKESGK